VELGAQHLGVRDKKLPYNNNLQFKAYQKKEGMDYMLYILDEI
jgi:hypothetical protein